MNDSTLNDLMGRIFQPPTGLYGVQQETPKVTLRDLLGKKEPVMPRMMSDEYVSPEDMQQIEMLMQEQQPEEEGEEGFLSRILDRITKPLQGVASIPDVLHDTNFKNPFSVMLMPKRYARNVLTGVAGGFGIGDPDYNSLEDFMDKYGIMEGSAAKPWVALAGDIALDPTTYLGGIGAIKGVKGLNKKLAAKKAGSGLGSMYK